MRSRRRFTISGEKYNYSIPLENPLLFKNTGSVPDNPAIQSVRRTRRATRRSTRRCIDDRTGRTDQVSFGNRGIPSLGDIGAYDSSTDPLVGGNENPYPAGYPSKPTISGLYGQDTMSDNFPNLNYWASGTVHGPGGYDKPSEGLVRGVETWRRGSPTPSPPPRAGGESPEAEPPDRLLRADPEEGDGHQHGDLRRGLQPRRRTARRTA